jgi:signal transduction histidine kinase
MLVAAWLVPLLAVGAISAWGAHQARVEAEYRANLELARAIAAAFRNFVKDVERQQQALGAVIASGRLSPAELTTFLERSAAEYTSLQAFAWVDVGGKVLAASDPRLAGRWVGDRDYFRRLLAGEDVVVSDLLQSGADGQATFVVARAVRAPEGAVRGAVLGLVEPARLGDLAVRLRRVGDAAIALVDTQGRLVFRSPPLDVRWEERYLVHRQPLVERALRGEDATGPVRSEVDGTPRLGAAVPVPELGWVARASRDRAEVTGPLWRDVGRATALSLVVTLLAVVVSLRIGGRLVRMLARLEGKADAVGRGLHAGGPVGGVREVERLSSALDLASARLLSATEDRNRSRAAEQFLLSAGAVLAGSLQFEQIVERLARLAVPALADACTIDEVDEEGNVRLLALAHADPAREPLAREERLRHPPPERAPERRAIAEKRTVHLPRVGARELEEMSAGPAHLEALARRGLRSCVAVPLLARGAVYGALTLVTAESERTLGAEAVRTAEDLASRAAQALDNAALFRQQQRAVRNRDQVLSLVSHDLRNLLSTVLLSARALEASSRRGEVPRETLERAVERIGNAGERMTRLIGDLLDLARLQEGRLSVHPSPQPAGAIAHEVAEAFRPQAEAKGLRVEVRAPADLPEVTADRDRAVQILSNLVSNAVKATEHGSVRISAEARGATVVFEVSDTGPGIPAEDLPHLFERFRRGSAAGYAGTGLGLAIARGLVHAHRGRIWVESAPGRGTQVSFTLPVAEGARAAAPPAGEVRPDGAPREQDGREART